MSKQQAAPGELEQVRAFVNTIDIEQLGAAQGLSRARVRVGVLRPHQELLGRLVRHVHLRKSSEGEELSGAPWRRGVRGCGSTMPTRSRPRFPASYSLHQEAEGMLDWGWAESRLGTARNYWVCTTSAGGAPHARPVWAVWLAQLLCFSTDAGSAKGRNIARDPRVTVHLDSGSDVVILEGVAEALPEDLTEALAQAYERKYDWRVTVGDSGWYAVRPARAYAWSEASFQTTATRFDF
jgi:hypothetical protein